jgi:hypothetical protein
MYPPKSNTDGASDVYKRIFSVSLYGYKIPKKHDEVSLRPTLLGLTNALDNNWTAWQIRTSTVREHLVPGAGKGGNMI